MGTSNDKMYSYEGDFKEQHAKHIKRPALVSIKKPLLSVDEMEDVLTRLLVHYVPPTEYNFNFKGVYRGIGRRAYLVDYSRTSIKEGQAGNNSGEELYLPSAVFEIGNKENVYLSTSVLATYGQEKDPLNSHQTLNPDKISAYLNTINPTKRLMQLGDRGYVEVVGKTDDLPGFTVDETALFSPYNSRYYSLLLLSKQDHEYLQMNKNTRKSQREEFVNNAYLFSDNGFLYYEKTVVIFDPNDRRGSKHFLDEIAIKKSFGYVPKSKVYAYKWNFAVPPSTKVNIYKSNQLADLWGDRQESKNRFLDQELAKLINEVQLVLQGMPKNGNYQYESAYASISAWVNLEVPENKETSTVSQTNKLEYGKQMCKGVIEASYTIDNKYVNSAGLTGPELETLYIYMRTQLTPGSILREICNNYLDRVNAVFKYNENAVPMLAYGNYAAELRKAELAMAKKNAIKRVFVTSTAYNKNLTLLDFKVLYYSVLIKKILEKREDLNSFIQEKIVTFPYNRELDQLKYYMEHVEETLANPTAQNIEVKELGGSIQTGKQSFVDLAETVLFSPLSGFFVTSLTDTITETKAPIWNSVADTSNFKASLGGVKLNADAARIILDNQNKDIARITIDRTVYGRSTASLLLKNNKQKYNFARGDIENRARFLIEPMDEVVIFLPTIHFSSSGGIQNYDGELEEVFTGIVSSVTDLNTSGYHSINISCECMKKLMHVNRTNVKPSANRDENGNNPITAFIVPNAFFNSIEKWMPFMFAQSLTYLRCQPIKTTLANQNKKLVEIKKQPIKEEQKIIVKKPTTVTLTKTETKVVPTYYKTETNNSLSNVYLRGVQSGLNGSIAGYNPQVMTQEEVDNYVNDPTMTASPDTKVVYSCKEEEREVETEYEVTVLNDTEVSRKMVLGYYDRVDFPDPLFTYLWYKRCSIYMPDIERNIIESSLTKLLNEYVHTDIIGSDGTHTDVAGAADYKNILKQGKRAAYIVYKQRFEGLLLGKDSGVDDRNIVARIVGSSQATFTLQTEALSIQFSNWKTNDEIINERASRFNFLYYTDRYGIINFTPYNLDLTTLNTTGYRKDTIDTDSMLITRSSRTLEADDNPQILKQQYVINYDKRVDDSVLVNWVRISGSWVVTSGINKYTQALVIDPVLMKKYGYRPAKNVDILGVQNQDSLRLYGLSWMDRQNKRFRSATATVLFDARMDINLPYYIPHDEIIYFCEGMRIDYTPAKTCVAALNLTFGKIPLLSIEKYAISNVTSSPYLTGGYQLNPYLTNSDGNSLLDELDNLFLNENKIKPTTYSQYKSLFRIGGGADIDLSLNPRTYEHKLSLVNAASSIKLPTAPSTGYESVTKRAAICCYNGYLWDNVAGITFEELVYVYGWLYGGKNVNGFVTAVGADSDVLMQPLQEVLANTSNSINISEEAQNAMNLYFVDIPAIDDPNALPEAFAMKEHAFTDLYVPNLISINTNKTPLVDEI